MKTLREFFTDWMRNGDPGAYTVTGWDFTKDARLPRPMAIRAKCLECQNGMVAEVTQCQIADCALWPWRMGRPLKPKEQAKTDTETESA